MYTLDQVRCFVAVADHLHFGKAAEELSMTQPPLSRQIQKLERFVGVTLIERDNRRVSLTPAGEAFLVNARTLLAVSDRAPRDARRIASGQWGRLSMGFTAASGFGILGSLVSVIEDRLPGIDLDLHEMVTGDQLENLAEGHIDLGIGRLEVTPPEIESELLLAERLLLAVPEAHPLAQLDRPLLRSDVTGQPLILHSATKATYFYNLIVRHFPIDRHMIKHSLSQVLTMVNLVADGHGIAFVPESTSLLRIPGVRYLEFADLMDDIVELKALWNRQSRNPALQRVLSVIRS
ncbi:transcriptional regulator [Brevibacterium sanguinis]|uniref:Transcriptional regulator n=2 Tax=Brevibacterium TaxID=1696 RepID=A0A366IIV1_9MICO|nr:MULTISPECIES: LysR family transcriptional regulator [Brevibacterium]RBP64987.1 transcriptional regulator [Brevibacterium sanguinis]RBP71250.1 transcriptional regulator [Brevibacterium celere]